MALQLVFRDKMYSIQSLFGLYVSLEFWGFAHVSKMCLQPSWIEFRIRKHKAIENQN